MTYARLCTNAFTVLVLIPGLSFLGLRRYGLVVPLPLGTLPLDTSENTSIAADEAPAPAADDDAPPASSSAEKIPPVLPDLPAWQLVAAFFVTI